MFDYFIIFIIMLMCVLVGIYLGMTFELRNSKKKKNSHTKQRRNKTERPLKKDFAPIDHDAHLSTNKGILVEPDPCTESEILSPGLDSKPCRQENATGILEKKIDSGSCRDDMDEADSIAEKMRNQDACFCTLKLDTDFQ